MGFRELAARYEGEFMRDMARLGVAPPDVMTRVTEYIPEVRGCKVTCVLVGTGGGGAVWGGVLVGTMALGLSVVRVVVFVDAEHKGCWLG